MEAKSIDFTFESEPSHEQIRALADHLEGLAAVAKIEVKVEKRGESSVADITLHGTDMPSDDELRANVEEHFAFVRDAAVEAAGDASQPPHGLPALDSLPKDPEQAETAIIEHLRSKGVTGDVQVEITTDEAGKRRVDVQVKDERISPR